MKTLLKGSLMVLAIALSGAAMAEDGFDYTPLAQFLMPPNESAEGSSERFAEMLEREPTAAGQKRHTDDSEQENYRSPERQRSQDGYQR